MIIKKNESGVYVLKHDLSEEVSVSLLIYPEINSGTNGIEAVMLLNDFVIDRRIYEDCKLDESTKTNILNWFSVKLYHMQDLFSVFRNIFDKEQANDEIKWEK
jgi:hypothetical protein